jgi:hypothetical protein
MEPDIFAGLDLARFSGLDISRYRLVLRAVEPASLPAFVGSTLRGAFGHALKDAVCVMPHRNCDRCMVMDRCLYPYLFETVPPSDSAQLKGQQQAPHPFILTPELSPEVAPEVAQTVSLRPDVAQAASLRPAVAQVGNLRPDVAQPASLRSSYLAADAALDIALAGPCDGSRSRNGAAGPSAQGPANLSSPDVKYVDLYHAAMKSKQVFLTPAAIFGKWLTRNGSNPGNLYSQTGIVARNESSGYRNGLSQTAVQERCGRDGQPAEKREEPLGGSRTQVPGDRDGLA